MARRAARACALALLMSMALGTSAIKCNIGEAKWFEGDPEKSLEPDHLTPDVDADTVWTSFKSCARLKGFAQRPGARVMHGDMYMGFGANCEGVLKAIEFENRQFKIEGGDASLQVAYCCDSADNCNAFGSEDSGLRGSRRRMLVTEHDTISLAHMETASVMAAVRRMVTMGPGEPDIEEPEFEQEP